MQEAVSTREMTGSASAGGGRARAVYVLYLVGLVFWPVAIVGVVVAYLDNSADLGGGGARPPPVPDPHRRDRRVSNGLIGFASSCNFAIGLNRIALVAIFGLLVPLLSPGRGCLLLVLLFAIVSAADCVGWDQFLPYVVPEHDMPGCWMLLTALLVWGLFWWTKRCLGGLRYLWPGRSRIQIREPGCGEAARLLLGSGETEAGGGDP